MTTTPSSQEEENFIGRYGQRAVQYLARGYAQPESHSFLMPPVGDQGPFSCLAKAADSDLYPPYHSRWKSIPFANFSEQAIEFLVDIFKCNQVQRKEIYECYRQTHPEGSIKHLESLAFRALHLPASAWSFVNDLPDNPPFANALRQIWQGIVPSSDNPDQEPSLSTNQYDETLSGRKSNADRNVPSGGRDAASDFYSVDTRSRNSDHLIPLEAGVSRHSLQRKKTQRQSRPKYFCMVSDCRKSKEGYVHEGGCVGHMLREHRNWTKENPGWETGLVRKTRPEGSDYSATKNPGTPLAGPKNTQLPRETSTRGARRLYPDVVPDDVGSEFHASAPQPAYNIDVRHDGLLWNVGTFPSPYSPISTDAASSNIIQNSPFSNGMLLQGSENPALMSLPAQRYGGHPFPPSLSAPWYPGQRDPTPQGHQELTTGSVNLPMISQYSPASPVRQEHDPASHSFFAQPWSGRHDPRYPHHRLVHNKSEPGYQTSLPNYQQCQPQSDSIQGFQSQPQNYNYQNQSRHENFQTQHQQYQDLRPQQPQNQQMQRTKSHTAPIYQPESLQQFPQQSLLPHSQQDNDMDPTMCSPASTNYHQRQR